MVKIAIYGKGGIGKSTTAANLALTLARLGKRVMQIGCDPKSDSTALLLRGQGCPTVLELLRSGAAPTLSDIVREGSGGVLCVEAGGPTPGVGCAGRGIITAFETLSELGAYEHFRPDAVLYDVLGDVVCGGFAMPMRSPYADRVCIVTSGEKMSLFAARNIASAVARFQERGYAALGGLILNRREVPGEEEKVRALAEELGTHVAADIPRSREISLAEERDMTAVEAFPDSPLADIYRALALRLMKEAGE